MRPLRPIGRPRIIWTPDMDAMLRAMRAAGCGYERCGNRIGVDKGVVADRVCKLGLPLFGHGQSARRAALAVRIDGLGA